MFHPIATELVIVSSKAQLLLDKLSFQWLHMLLEIVVVSSITTSADKCIVSSIQVRSPLHGRHFLIAIIQSKWNFALHDIQHYEYHEIGPPGLD